MGNNPMLPTRLHFMLNSANSPLPNGEFMVAQRQNHRCPTVKFPIGRGILVRIMRKLSFMRNNFYLCDVVATRVAQRRFY